MTHSMKSSLDRLPNHVNHNYVPFVGTSLILFIVAFFCSYCVVPKHRGKIVCMKRYIVLSSGHFRGDVRNSTEMLKADFSVIIVGKTLSQRNTATFLNNILRVPSKLRTAFSYLLKSCSIY